MSSASSHEAAAVATGSASNRNGIGRRRARLIVPAVLLTDALFLLLCFHLSTHLVQPERIAGGVVPIWLRSSWWLGGQPAWRLLLGAVLIGWLAGRRHYEERRPFRDVAKDIVLGVGAVTIADGWLEHLAGLDRRPVAWHGYSWLIVGAGLIAGRAFIRSILDRADAWRRRTLVIGDRRTCDRVRRFLTHNADLACPVMAEFAVDERTGSPATALRSVLAAEDLDFAVLGGNMLEPAILAEIGKVLDEFGVDYSLACEFEGTRLIAPQLRRGLGHDMVLVSRGQPPVRERVRTAVKRSFDLLVAGAAVIALAPLLLLLAAIIKLDGGPILFRSTRVGRSGQTFSCLKFRSMVPDAENVLQRLLSQDPELRAEWEAHFKLRNDPRITAVGRFLRASSFDELPQFLNVLRGEMSIVGPRPLLPDEVDAYGPAIALYHRCRPGITGLWQVSGRNDLDYADRIQLNTWYLNNWSLRTDLMIFFRTIQVLLHRTGAL